MTKGKGPHKNLPCLLAAYLFSTATGVPGSRTQREVAGGDHAPRRLQHGGRSVLGDKRSRDGRPWRWPAESGCLWNWGIPYGRWWSIKSWDTLCSNKFRWTLEYNMFWETKDNTLGSPKHTKAGNKLGDLVPTDYKLSPRIRVCDYQHPSSSGQLGSSQIGQHMRLQPPTQTRSVRGGTLRSSGLQPLLSQYFMALIRPNYLGSKPHFQTDPHEQNPSTSMSPQ